MPELSADILHRNKIFEELKKAHDEELHNKEKPIADVEIDAGDGTVKTFQVKLWQDSPGTLLKHLDKAVAAEVVVAKINGTLWDLSRPFESACRVLYIPFSTTEGRNVFWHSSAHILGEACESHFAPHCLLSHGPPVEEGFFYDMRIGEGDTIKETDKPLLQKESMRIIKEKQPFERLHVSLKDLESMFSYSKYKMHYIKNLLPPEGSTVYRCGTLVDLCLGPHIQHTGKPKAFSLMKNSSCYFLGDKDGDTLQRIYGVAFPDKKLLEVHMKFLEEAAKRNHRKIGVEQELFFFNDLSPGCPFLLPHGIRIYSAIQAMLRDEYHSRGYSEVQSPNMFDTTLWKTSGHYLHYAKDMFALKVEEREWALKPMNCPGHCLIFSHRERSYKELPLRLAEFGVLHRNEASGALSGLTRVRRFVQDDAHIFCTVEQITEEIEAMFDFLKYVYGLFGFSFKLLLSTRPEKYLGEIETWNNAEQRLRGALDKFTANESVKWEENPGDGAFYGPKIDIEISDALNRGFQCATIQLDFQLPQNFGLEYMTGDAVVKPDEPGHTLPKREKGSKSLTKGDKTSKPKSESKDDLPKPTPAAPEPKEPPAVTPGHARPVIIHRAIIGSFERFMAIITENFAGKWPFWLSPRQVLVVPVMPEANDYVLEVHAALNKERIHVDYDISGNTMAKKILRGQQAQYNFIFVVGAQERESRTVNIRNRDDLKTQTKGALVPLDMALRKLVDLRKEMRLENAL